MGIGQEIIEACKGKKGKRGKKESLGEGLEHLGAPVMHEPTSFQFRDAVTNMTDQESLDENRQRWNKFMACKNCRVHWGGAGANHDMILIEELPGKPVKRKVRYMTVDLGFWSRWKNGDAYFLPGNIMRDAKIKASDDYDAVVKKITKSIEKAKKELGEKQIDLEQWEKAWKGTGGIKSMFYERTRPYLEVEPDDYEPMNVEGKDFNLHAKWDTFTAYAPDSDFQQADWYYTGYEAASPTSARMMFKLAKADPGILLRVPFDKLGDWLKKNKIKYRHIESTWR